MALVEDCAQAHGATFAGRPVGTFGSPVASPIGISTDWETYARLTRGQVLGILALEGGARDAMLRLIPAGHRPVIHLTLTDDHPWAQAFVIIEVQPA